MNTATQNLENDHIYILRLLDVMEKMTTSTSTEISDLEKVVNLIRNYADAFHHAKEENILFPFLIEKGFPKEKGPISVMLNEHKEGRNYVREMAAGIIALNQGHETALTGIYVNMQDYIDLLRTHIAKENNVLFRMADQALSDEEQQKLLIKFAELETKDFGNDKISNYISVIERLEEIYE